MVARCFMRDGKDRSEPAIPGDLTGSDDELQTHLEELLAVKSGIADITPPVFRQQLVGSGS